MEEKEYWYWLCNLKGIGVRKITALLACFEHPETIYNAEKKYLSQLNVLSEGDIKELTSERNRANINESYGKLKEKGIRFFTNKDTEFPEGLKNIYDAPVCLYVRGDLPVREKKTIAIVGARNCSNYGKEIAFYFSKALSQAGIQVVSGLAMGIDGYAHKGALEGKEPTFGVMGCGIDICYPASHIELYMKMQNHGGIISEYGPGMPAKPGNFPMRNRIISGLSDGILVVEAKEKSGSLITADMALEQGKDVFAIPGRICDNLSKGSNNLIKMGAELVNEPEDILKYYNVLCKDNMKNMIEDKKYLEPDEKLIFNGLSIIPKHINQIVAETNIGLLEVIQILGILEKKNWIKQTTKNYYSIIL